MLLHSKTKSPFLFKLLATVLLLIIPFSVQANCYNNCMKKPGRFATECSEACEKHQKRIEKNRAIQQKSLQDRIKKERQARERRERERKERAREQQKCTLQQSAAEQELHRAVFGDDTAYNKEVLSCYTNCFMLPKLSPACFQACCALGTSGLLLKSEKILTAPLPPGKGIPSRPTDIDPTCYDTCVKNGKERTICWDICSVDTSPQNK